MVVKDRVVGREEGCSELLTLIQSLDNIINNTKDVVTNDTEDVLANVSYKLKELKEQLRVHESKQCTSAVDNVMDEIKVKVDTKAPILAAIKKVSEWQNSLPPSTKYSNLLQQSAMQPKPITATNLAKHQPIPGY